MWPERCDRSQPGREKLAAVRGEMGIPDVERAQVGIVSPPRRAAPALFSSAPRCLSTRS